MTARLSQSSIKSLFWFYVLITAPVAVAGFGCIYAYFTTP